MADSGHLGNEPEKVPSRFLTSVSFLFVLIGLTRHLNDIESKGFIYVPIFSWFEDSES